MWKNIILLCLLATIYNIVPSFRHEAQGEVVGDFPTHCTTDPVDDQIPIRPKGVHDPFFVTCVESTRWIIILKRENDHQNFSENKDTYKNGFGDLRGSHWAGLENIHKMTRYVPHEMMVNLTYSGDVTAYARYEYFAIGSENMKYNLKILGKFSGTAIDAMTRLSGWAFSTHHEDNTADQSMVNCTGGWWHRYCGLTNPTGNYNVSDGSLRIFWDKKENATLEKLVMMIRPLYIANETILPTPQ